eukprot:bmy_06588T0
MQIRRWWAAQWAGAYADETVTAGPAGGRAGGLLGRGGGTGRGVAAGPGRAGAAFSFPVSPERGRLRGWLEGSLAGLCELHWLRERQEYRVQQALRLAQPGMGGAEAEDEEDADEDEDAAAARRAAAALEERRAGSGLPAPKLGKGVALPRPDPQAHSLHPFPKENPSGHQQGSKVDSIEISHGDAELRQTMGASGWQWSKGRRRMWSLLGAKEPVGVHRCSTIPLRLDSQKDFPEALPGLIWDLGQQLGDLSLESGGLEQESGRSSGFYEDPSSTGGPDSPPSTFCGDSGFSGSGSYGRLGPSEPRGIYASERPKSLGDASPSAHEAVGARAAVPRSFSAPYPTAAVPEACSSAERRARAGPFLTPSPLHAVALRSPRPPAEGRLVKAQYIPGAQAATRGLPGRAARRKAPPLTRGRSVEQSPPRERPRAAGRRGRMTEASGRRGSPRARKAARSQSETSLLGRAAAVPPGPPKYPTAEREEPRPPRPRRGPAPTLAAQAAGSCRRWRSTAEIDAADGRRGRPRGPAARGPGPGPSPSAPQRRLLYGCAGSDSECSAGRLGPLGRRGPTGGIGVGYGESESSASEGESPAFSSASSDSDGSGGLVWPQQLVAATAASGPGAGAGGGAPAGPAKVFVKIKASHALKKKILRFRSGSLKVMTTV